MSLCTHVKAHCFWKTLTATAIYWSKYKNLLSKVSPYAPPRATPSYIKLNKQSKLGECFCSAHITL